MALRTSGQKKRIRVIKLKAVFFIFILLAAD